MGYNNDYEIKTYTHLRTPTQLKYTKDIVETGNQDSLNLTRDSLRVVWNMAMELEMVYNYFSRCGVTETGIVAKNGKLKQPDWSRGADEAYKTARGLMIDIQKNDEELKKLIESSTESKKKKINVTNVPGEADANTQDEHQIYAKYVGHRRLTITDQNTHLFNIPATMRNIWNRFVQKNSAL
jgi:hypothetical protein